jgi:hypothetical protein
MNVLGTNWLLFWVGILGLSALETPQLLLICTFTVLVCDLLLATRLLYCCHTASLKQCAVHPSVFADFDDATTQRQFHCAFRWLESSARPITAKAAGSCQILSRCRKWCLYCTTVQMLQLPSRTNVFRWQRVGWFEIKRLRKIIIVFIRACVHSRRCVLVQRLVWFDYSTHYKCLLHGIRLTGASTRYL